jgi:hypothetical protein
LRSGASLRRSSESLSEIIEWLLLALPLHLVRLHVRGLAHMGRGPGQPHGQAAPGPRAGAGRHAARSPGYQVGAILISQASSTSTPEYAVLAKPATISKAMQPSQFQAAWSQSLLPIPASFRTCVRSLTPISFP